MIDDAIAELAPAGGQAAGMPPDTDADICPWRVLDPATWRAGVLFTASADFLVLWHTTAASLRPDVHADIEERFGDLVDRVRWARLARDLDGIKTASLLAVPR